MQPILIIDYGMANLRSVQKAFESQGQLATITGDPEQVRRAAKIVLPGVGAFRDAIAQLRQTGLDVPILEHLRAGKPFFGICLGMQMLFERSYEDGVYEGLGVFRGDVVRFTDQPGLKVPHMGWNQIRVTRSAPPLDGLHGQSFYFVHSYYPVPTDPHITAAEADYPTPFTCAVWQENIFATQFHPEKSQRVGLQMLRRFAEWR